MLMVPFIIHRYCMYPLMQWIVALSCTQLHFSLRSARHLEEEGHFFGGENFCSPGGVPLLVTFYYLWLAATDGYVLLFGRHADEIELKKEWRW